MKLTNKGSGWHFESMRHSNARKFGHAGGQYASKQIDRTLDPLLFKKLYEETPPATVPLSFINNPEKYKEVVNKRKLQREHLKEYFQRPEVKARQQEYAREYFQRPEIKARERERAKEYYQRPEVKARLQEYAREYLQRPEVKARYARKYKQRLKERTLK